MCGCLEEDNKDKKALKPQPKAPPQYKDYKKGTVLIKGKHVSFLTPRK